MWRAGPYGNHAESPRQNVYRATTCYDYAGCTAATAATAVLLRSMQLFSMAHAIIIICVAPCARTHARTAHSARIASQGVFADPWCWI